MRNPIFSASFEIYGSDSFCCTHSLPGESGRISKKGEHGLITHSVAELLHCDGE